MPIGIYAGCLISDLIFSHSTPLRFLKLSSLRDFSQKDSMILRYASQIFKTYPPFETVCDISLRYLKSYRKFLYNNVMTRGHTDTGLTHVYY